MYSGFYTKDRKDRVCTFRDFSDFRYKFFFPIKFRSPCENFHLLLNHEEKFSIQSLDFFRITKEEKSTSIITCTFNTEL